MKLLCNSLDMGSPSSPLAIGTPSHPHRSCSRLGKRPLPNCARHPSGKNSCTCARDESSVPLPTTTGSLRNRVTRKRAHRCCKMSTGRGIKRIVLTLQQRLDVVQKLQYDVSVNQLAIDYDIDPTTVRRIRSKAAELRQWSQIPGAATRRKMRKPVLADVDTHLYAWYLERRGLRDNITDTMLQEKAKKLNEQFGGPSTFLASKGWAWRFKNRHAIGLHDPYSDNVEADTVVAQVFTQALLTRLEEQNI